MEQAPGRLRLGFAGPGRFLGDSDLLPNVVPAVTNPSGGGSTVAQGRAPDPSRAGPLASAAPAHRAAGHAVLLHTLLRSSAGWKIGLAAGALVAIGLALNMTSGGKTGLAGLAGDLVPTGNAQAMATHATAGDRATLARKQAASIFRPSEAQWQTLGVEDVKPASFVETMSTDGKIAIDEDHTTPVFSPYAGRVVRLMVKPGDTVAVGAPLFTIDAVDMVQAQNDFLSTTAGMNKARSAVQLAEKSYARNKTLVESKAAALKDLQAAEDALTAAQNDLRSAEAAAQAARNRLAILGKSQADIEMLTMQGRISAETTVYAPIAGTIVQRKVGPGQFLAAGASDPAFIIGDLSTVWLLGNVREMDAPKIRVGQPLEFKTLAIPDRVFKAKVGYVSPAVDATTRRLMVRAEIPNPGGLLKPEMFTSVSIITSVEDNAASVPRSALVQEDGVVRVWVALPDKSIELRKIEVGLTSRDAVQVRQGLAIGEKVVTRGSLFIDRVTNVKK